MPKKYNTSKTQKHVKRAYLRNSQNSHRPQ
jgi:hypothetical protein